MRSLGVDLGGSGFRLGVFDTSSGRLEGYLERHAHAESTDPEAVLSALEAAIDAIGWEGPIGLGFPGAINDHRPVTAPNLGEAWTRTDVKTRLEPFHKGRFAMLNDADAVAEAERRWTRSGCVRLDLDHRNRLGHHAASRRCDDRQFGVRSLAASTSTGVA